ncbi:hypothetical protein VTO73DRAFT_10906 [Trametes versicolor]
MGEQILDSISLPRALVLDLLALDTRPADLPSHPRNGSTACSSSGSCRIPNLHGAKAVRCPECQRSLRTRACVPRTPFGEEWTTCGDAGGCMGGGRLGEARYQHRQDPSAKQQNPESLTEIQGNTAEIPESFDRTTADIKGLEADGRIVEEVLPILLDRASPAPAATA